MIASLTPIAADDLGPDQTAPTHAGAMAVDAMVGRWWVLHTKPRNEKATAADLERRGVQHFLPLVVRQHRSRGRVWSSSVPLFPSYVFCCGRDDDRLTALRTNRIAHVLEVGDQDRFRDDLRQIQRVIASREPVNLFPRLHVGARCRVIGGPLAGLEGVVLRRRGAWRIYVSIAFLGQSAELEIDADRIELID